MKLDPGVNEIDIHARGYGATLVVDVKDPSESGYDRRYKMSGRIEVDPTFVSRNTLMDIEDDLLAAASRALGKRLSWGEGDWGANYTHGTLDRAITIRS